MGDCVIRISKAKSNIVYRCYDSPPALYQVEDLDRGKFYKLIKKIDMKKHQLLKIEIPEGFYPKVFETLYENQGGKMVQNLYIYCEKSPKLKKVSFKK